MRFDRYYSLKSIQKKNAHLQTRTIITVLAITLVLALLPNICLSVYRYHILEHACSNVTVSTDNSNVTVPAANNSNVTVPAANNFNVTVPAATYFKVTVPAVCDFNVTVPATGNSNDSHTSLYNIYIVVIPSLSVLYHILILKKFNDGWQDLNGTAAAQDINANEDKINKYGELTIVPRKATIFSALSAIPGTIVFLAWQIFPVTLVRGMDLVAVVYVLTNTFRAPCALIFTMAHLHHVQDEELRLIEVEQRRNKELFHARKAIEERESRRKESTESAWELQEIF